MSPIDPAVGFGALFDEFLRDDLSSDRFADAVVAAARQRMPGLRVALYEIGDGTVRPLSDGARDRLHDALGVLDAAGAGRETILGRTAAVFADVHSIRFALVAESAEERFAPEAIETLRVLIRLFVAFVRRQTPSDASAGLTDPLTGLANRSALLRAGEIALSTARRTGQLAALLYIDLDGFKAINDGNGHAAGDSVLRELAQRLRAVARRGEEIGRLGGDEFVAIVPRVADPNEAVEIGHRLLEAIRQPVSVDPLQVRLSASIGIALFPHDGTDVDALLAASDAAMYRAKRAGGSRVYPFSESIRAEVETRRRLTQELRHARIGNEFVASYQPIIDVSTGQVIAAEALARWRHPHAGMLAAADVIETLGTRSLTGPIDRWIIGAVAHESRTWIDRGLTSLNINVGVPDVRLFEEYDRVRAAEPFAVPLAIEIAERGVMESPEPWYAFVAAARLRSIPIGIDNFGVSPIALDVIERLAPDFVKLDRTLVARIDTAGSPHGAAYAAISLAHAFRCTVYAHGVENDAQRAWLASCGVRAVQGYGFGVPMTADEFDNWSSPHNRYGVAG